MHIKEKEDEKLKFVWVPEWMNEWMNDEWLQETNLHRELLPRRWVMYYDGQLWSSVASV
jgi:hypothetical protein